MDRSIFYRPTLSGLRGRANLDPPRPASGRSRGRDRGRPARPLAARAAETAGDPPGLWPLARPRPRPARPRRRAARPRRQLRHGRAAARQATGGADRRAAGADVHPAGDQLCRRPRGRRPAEPAPARQAVDAARQATGGADRRAAGAGRRAARPRRQLRHGRAAARQVVTPAACHPPAAGACRRADHRSPGTERPGGRREGPA